MSNEQMVAGDTVHVYRQDGEYLGTAVYKGEISICKLASEENIVDSLKNTAFGDVKVPYVEIIGSDELQYGLECYFDTQGPRIH